MIPKIIHYCWFGGNPLPELAQKCIASWKKFCPDYEIVRWDESNFDLDCCDYVREAYKAKKWAFVSDYARFKILYEHGGLYFDTDVELIKPIDDIVARGPFMGCERLLAGARGAAAERSSAAAPGLGLGANPGLGLYKKVLADYERSHFETAPNGFYQTVVNRVTGILEKEGFDGAERIQTVTGVTIYPPEYFAPLNYYTGELQITENTRSIHHYMATWLGKTEKRITQINHKLAEHRRLARCATFPLRVLNKLEKLGFGGTVRFAVKELKTAINYRGGVLCNLPFCRTSEYVFGGAV